MKAIINCGHGEFNGYSKRSPGLPKDPCNQADYWGIVEAQNTRQIGQKIGLMLFNKGIHGEVVNAHCPINISMKDRVAYTNNTIKSGTPAIHVALHHNAKGKGGDWNDAHGFRALYFPFSKASKKAAEAMVDIMRQYTQFRDYRTVASVWTRRLYELLRTTGPAIIEEAGFQTNRQDTEYIKSIYGQQEIAEGNAAWCKEVSTW